VRSEKTLNEFYQKFFITNETTLHRDPLWQSSNDLHISYLLIAKSASSTLRAKINGTTCKQSKCPGIDSDEMFRFTFVRDPMIRVISAYREIHRRGVPICLDQKGYELPSDDATEEELVNHMNLQIQFMMTLMQQRSGINLGADCDSHPRPQIEYLRGHNDMDMIGCIYENADLPDSKDLTNVQLQHIYEETGCKPFDQHSEQKQIWGRPGKDAGGVIAFNAWQRAKFLTEQTKQMVREFYHDDFAIYEYLCGSNENPNPMFGN